MLDWDWLIGDTVIGPLLPLAYGRYRRPIVEGLRLFLRRLPGSDVAQILADQAALAADSPAAERLVALAERCPALHKLGQVLARDRRLALELRLQLQRLESLPPTTPIATIEQTLSSEIGSLEKAGVVLHPPALAEASVAVVLPFTCAAASREGLPPRGVFKVLKPGIEERLARELSLLEDVGSLLDDRCAAFGIPPLEYREVFEQVREKLGTEVDLGGEQRHLNEAADTYAAEPEVLIPKLFPGLCTARVTAMERVDGHKVTEPGKHDAWGRRRLAELIVEALVAGPIWSEAPCATFHADPHAGNLFVTPDRRLAILDWSLTGALGEDERVAITQIVMGGLSLNSAQVRSALLSLALQQRVDETILKDVVEHWLRKVRAGSFPGFSWLTGMLDDAVLRARLRAGTDLILFRKTILTLEGVLADVSGSVSIDELLPSLFLRRLVAEWPRRLLAPPWYRGLPTRLSTEDLALLIMRLPSTPARGWMETALEMLSRGRSGQADTAR
ncbi:MAG TPA: AarF/UbiB family protein [Isosphaeraceae bacterium]|nr:AarF/UbiB family protein [Isosphaeraceae bacterium]